MEIIHEKLTKTPQTSGEPRNMSFSLPPQATVNSHEPTSMINTNLYPPPLRTSNQYNNKEKTFLQVATRTTKDLQHTTPYALQTPKSMEKIAQQVDSLLNILKTKIPTSFPKPQWLPKSLSSLFPKYPHFTISFNKIPQSQLTYSRALTTIRKIINEETAQKFLYFIQMKGKHLEVYLKEPQNPTNNLSPSTLLTNSIFPLPTTPLTTNTTSTNMSMTTNNSSYFTQEKEKIMIKLQENIHLFLQHEPPNGATHVRINRLEATHYHTIIIKGIPLSWNYETITRVLFEVLKLPQGIIEAPYIETPQPKGRSQFIHLLYNRPQIFFSVLAASKTFNFKIEEITLSWDYMKPPKGYRKWCTHCHGPHNPIECPFKVNGNYLTTISLEEPIITESFIKKNQVQEKRRFEWIQVSRITPQRTNITTPIIKPITSPQQLPKLPTNKSPTSSLYNQEKPNTNSKPQLKNFIKQSSFTKIGNQEEIPNNLTPPLATPIGKEKELSPENRNTTPLQTTIKHHSTSNTISKMKKTAETSKPNNLQEEKMETKENKEGDQGKSMPIRQSQSVKKSRPGSITKFLSNSQEVPVQENYIISNSKSLRTKPRTNGDSINRPNSTLSSSHIITKKQQNIL
jgi:hypothetical protein